MFSSNVADRTFQFKHRVGVGSIHKERCSCVVALIPASSPELVPSIKLIHQTHLPNKTYLYWWKDCTVHFSIKFFKHSTGKFSSWILYWKSYIKLHNKMYNLRLDITPCFFYNYNGVCLLFKLFNAVFGWTRQ